jgi:site-specific DNA-cytosine methylase
MNQPINVLSLFDGISCGMIALERAGIEVNKYYASEIYTPAIQVSKQNYPDIIQIGDVTKVDVSQLSNINRIDLLIGGSPCTNLSVAGKMEGLGGQESKLFFEYVRILNDIRKYNPDVKFLLENVKMKKEYQDIISGLLGVKPVNINSKLVSAQLRNRFYWTNIGEISQPEDKNIKLQDILTSGFTDREKARAILESESRPLVSKDKMWHRYNSTGFTTIVYEKSIEDKENIRYFNQTELERLQTLPEGYTKSVSRNIAAGLIGNGWTVDVIAHILKNIIN